MVPHVFVHRQVLCVDPNVPRRPHSVVSRLHPNLRIENCVDGSLERVLAVCVGDVVGVLVENNLRFLSGRAPVEDHVLLESVELHPPRQVLDQGAVSVRVKVHVLVQLHAGDVLVSVVLIDFAAPQSHTERRKQERRAVEPQVQVVYLLHGLQKRAGEAAKFVRRERGHLVSGNLVYVVAVREQGIVREEAVEEAVHLVQDLLYLRSALRCLLGKIQNCLDCGSGPTEA